MNERWRWLGPWAAFLVIPGGGHLAPVTHKHMVVPVMAEYLRRHAPPSNPASA